METRIYNLIILDESGSMASIKREAIGGFNDSPLPRPLSTREGSEGFRHTEFAIR
ncbi:MAG: hypothetical protein LBT76_03235 [Tannerella sp.]|jgi:hypothetical protein|nr:hypothetical protein [Tannerella sp.]